MSPVLDTSPSWVQLTLPATPMPSAGVPRIPNNIVFLLSPPDSCRTRMHRDNDHPAVMQWGLSAQRLGSVRVPFLERRAPTHLLELRVDELQPVGVNLIQVIAAAPGPSGLGPLTKGRVIWGHLCRGAFQWWEDPGKGRRETVRAGSQPAPSGAPVGQV